MCKLYTLTETWFSLHCGCRAQAGHTISEQDQVGQTQTKTTTSFGKNQHWHAHTHSFLPVLLYLLGDIDKLTVGRNKNCVF